MDLKKEFLTMTLKGITRTCYGSMFNDEDEVRKMSNIYQKVKLFHATALSLMHIHHIVGIVKFRGLWPQIITPKPA